MSDGKVLVSPPRASDLASSPSEDAVSPRINADPEDVEKGLAQLVLTIVELLRQLMERQALRRVEAGGLMLDRVARWTLSAS
jgi:hypothetical protein